MAATASIVALAASAVAAGAAVDTCRRARGSMQVQETRPDWKRMILFEALWLWAVVAAVEAAETAEAAQKQHCWV